jgi:hypothetical protein
MNNSEVIELNNRAVTSLQRGCHKEANGLLREAIADLMDQFSAHQQSCSFSPQTVDSVSPIEMQVDITPPTASPSSPALSSKSEDSHGKSSYCKIEEKQGTTSILSVPLWPDASLAQSQDETLVFMYSRVLVLAHTKHSRETLTGVILFNMALVIHARTVECGTITLLSTALKFYGKAAAVIQNDNAASACDHWILLAIYNNMAQIHLSRSNSRSEEFCMCLSNIEALLASENIANVIDDDDYYFFFRNSMLHKVKTVAAPAA